MTFSAPDLRLRPLRADDETNAIAAHEELEAEGFQFLLDWRRDEPWSAYLHKLEQLRRGLEMPRYRIATVAAHGGPARLHKKSRRFISALDWQPRR